jgi:hypothetical protein
MLKRGLAWVGTLVAASTILYLALLLVFGTMSAVTARSSSDQAEAATAKPRSTLFTRGRRIFRFDTFGDEAFWGGQLRLHQAVAGASNGGLGPGLSPKAALALGLKVDAAAIPQKVAAAIKAGQVNLNDPKVTVDLLKLNAVVGVRGFFDANGTLTSIGITCAACHSTVDDSFAPGIGSRLDGWPNQDLDVGKIVALSPSLQPFTDLLGVEEATVKKVLTSWGPGKFDAQLILDGKGFQPNGRSAATRIPAAFGLAGVNLATYTGWGTVTYWNAFVSNLEMHGLGRFEDSRLDDRRRFPVAAKARLGHKRDEVDRISAKLGALHFYQLALTAPRPPKGSFDPAAAKRGEAIFNGDGATCVNCHTPPTYSEPGRNVHRPAEICTDPFQANRSPTGAYRTTPLRGLHAKSKRGFWHDGRFPSLRAVVNHYDRCFKLGLSARQKSDLVHFLKSR